MNLQVGEDNCDQTMSHIEPTEAVQRGVAQEYIRWVEANGHPSLGQRPDESEEARVRRTLAQWYRWMKMAALGDGRLTLYPSVENLLVDTFGSEWYVFEDLEAEALERTQEYIRWVEVNGHPSLGQRPYESEDAKERRSLEVWYLGMKNAAKGYGRYALYPSVAELLAATFGPGWYENDRDAAPRGTSAGSR
jgi:hypothetical protein